MQDAVHIPWYIAHYKSYFKFCFLCQGISFGIFCIVSQSATILIFFSHCISSYKTPGNNSTLGYGCLSSSVYFGFPSLLTSFKFMYISCSLFCLHICSIGLQFPMYYWLWYNFLWMSMHSSHTILFLASLSSFFHQYFFL